MSTAAPVSTAAAGPAAPSALPLPPTSPPLAPDLCSPSSMHAQQMQAAAMAEAILASPKASATINHFAKFAQFKASGLKSTPSLSSSPSSGSLSLDDTSSAGTSPSPLSDQPPGDDPDHCALFIGDLPRQVTEDQLREAFCKYGEVVAAEVKRDKVTRNNLGYGFVQFRTRAGASTAKTAMEGAVIGNRQIRVGWAQKNTTLFIGELDGSVTTEMLREAFAKLGPLFEHDTFVKSAGTFGFVRYQRRADAEAAKQLMNRQQLGTATIRVGWGDSNHQRHCVNIQFNPQIAKPNMVTEPLLRSLFEPFGTVVAVNVPRFPEGPLKGYAFIHFQENSEGEAAASAAIDTFNGKEVLPGLPVKCSYGKKRAAHKRGWPPKPRYDMQYGPFVAVAVQADGSSGMRADSGDGITYNWMPVQHGYPAAISPVAYSPYPPPQAHSPHFFGTPSPIAHRTASGGREPVQFSNAPPPHVYHAHPHQQHAQQPSTQNSSFAPPGSAQTPASSGGSSGREGSDTGSTPTSSASLPVALHVEVPLSNPGAGSGSSPASHHSAHYPADPSSIYMQQYPFYSQMQPTVYFSPVSPANSFSYQSGRGSRHPSAR